MIRFFLMLFVLFHLNNLLSQDLAKIQWNEDLDFFKDKLPKKHVNLFFKLSPLEFNTYIENIKKDSNSLTDEKVPFRLQCLLAKVGDSHTSVQLAYDKLSYLPISPVVYPEGVFIIKGPKEILGKKLQSINNIPISIVIDSLTKLIVNDNPSMLKARLPHYLRNGDALKFFKIVEGDSIVYGYQDENSTTQYFVLPLDSCDALNKKSITLKPKKSKNPSFKIQNPYHGQEYIEKDSVYYVRYNICESKWTAFYTGVMFGQPHEPLKSIPSFSRFKKQVLKDLKHKPVKKLVFDLRTNGGGNSSLGTKLIKKISKIKSINQEGKIFVLVGRKTFSAAFENTIDFKKHTKAIVIGESPSQKPFAYGDIRYLILPNSKLPIWYSVRYYEFYKGPDPNRYIPDVEVPETFNDYLNGIDRAYLMSLEYGKEL
jgi:hypothetical protein